MTAKNLSGRDVKCCMSAKVFGEDGSLKDFKKEKNPVLRAHNATFSLSGLCRHLKFLTQQGTLLLQVRARRGVLMSRFSYALLLP